MTKTSLTEFRHQMRSGDLLVLVSELSFKWHSFIFLMLFCSNSAHFSETQHVCNGRTDGRTDTPSYKDARTHWKTFYIARRLQKDSVKGVADLYIRIPVASNGHWAASFDNWYSWKRRIADCGPQHVATCVDGSLVVNLLAMWPFCASVSVVIVSDSWNNAATPWVNDLFSRVWQ